MKGRRSRSLLACALLAAPLLASAQGAPDSAARIEAQRQAMLPLAVIDGTWRGKATVSLPDGQKVEHTQTERVGSFLGGSVKVIEGRGFGSDGAVVFNAFGIISYSSQTGKHSMRSYAQGYSGDFPIEVRADGFSWSIPAGPATLRYTATVKDGVWTEVGERLVEGKPPVQTFEMTLQRIGNTDWPVAGAVAAN